MKEYTYTTGTVSDEHSFLIIFCKKNRVQLDFFDQKISVAVVLNKPRSKYITKLSIVGWGMPLLFTVIVLIVESTTGKGYKLNFEYAQSILETNFWVFLDTTMYYVFILTPFVIIWLFNLGSNLALLKFI